MSFWTRVRSPGGEPSAKSQSGQAQSQHTKPIKSRRAVERARQRLMDGFITSERMPAPRPCTICDLTPKGSKVELWGEDIRKAQPGDRVTLYIPGDAKEADGEVVWRRENAIGLKFTSPFRAPTRRYG